MGSVVPDRVLSLCSPGSDNIFFLTITSSSSPTAYLTVNHTNQHTTEYMPIKKYLFFKSMSASLRILRILTNTNITPLYHVRNMAQIVQCVNSTLHFD